MMEENENRYEIFSMPIVSLQLHEIAPPLDEVRGCLLLRPYNGPDPIQEGNEMEVEEEEEVTRATTTKDNNSTVNLFTFEDLCQRVRCSNEQLRVALQTVNALEIDGKVPANEASSLTLFIR